MSELLTPEERALKPLNICGCEQVNDDSDRCRGCYRTALHYESVIIPARIAEAKRETLEKIADTQEEIDNMVAKAVAEERAKLIKWLDEPCTEHPYFPYPLQGDPAEYRYHRRDCPECIAKLKRDILKTP